MLQIPLSDLMKLLHTDTYCRYKTKWIQRCFCVKTNSCSSLGHFQSNHDQKTSPVLNNDVFFLPHSLKKPLLVKFCCKFIQLCLHVFSETFRFHSWCEILHALSYHFSNHHLAEGVQRGSWRPLIHLAAPLFSWNIISNITSWMNPSTKTVVFLLHFTLSDSFGSINMKLLNIIYIFLCGFSYFLN